ncbi:MAG: type II toxin-antitoxin system RelE/ParE family toxin [Candidatus Diapherotrites archaeon]
MYEVVFSEKAERQLKKLDKKTQERVISVIERVRIRPEAHLQKLMGEHAYKIRVGDYRVIVDLDNRKKMLFIHKVGHRKNIYNKL